MSSSGTVSLDRASTRSAAEPLAGRPLFWRHRRGRLRLGTRPLIMGILNVTPDSFSDGGRYATPDMAVARGLEIETEGADIIDIGGESTRPGARETDGAEEIKRVIPVIRALRRRTDIPISVDTMKSEVARQALDAGADIVNDVSACTRDSAMPGLAAKSKAGVLLMHMRGTPSDMQDAPAYVDVAREVAASLRARANALQEQGVERESLALDPGIGFGKTLDHNLELLARLDDLTAMGYPVAVGLSRKSFIGTLTGRDVNDRLAGSLAALVFCMLRGAHILRVHDVQESRDAVTVASALERIYHGME